MADKRHRSAESGRMVSQEEAEAKPEETVAEDRSDAARLKAIEARLDKLEDVITRGEAYARAAYQ